MSKTFGFFKDMIPRGNVTSSNYPVPTYSNISIQLSNVAYADLSDTISLTMNTNLVNNQTFYLTVNGVDGNIFVDGSNVASANVNGSGNLAISKVIANHSNVNLANTSFTVTLRASDPTVGEVIYTSNTLYVRTVGTTSLQTTVGTNTSATVYTNQSGYDIAIARITSAVNLTSVVGRANIRAINSSVTTAPIRYLIVGGGGSAGEGFTSGINNNLKGGGAGGYALSGNSNVTVNTYYLATIGNGGRSAFNYPTTYDGTRAYGNASTFLGVTANGGAAGGWGNVTTSYSSQSGRNPGGGGGPGASGGSADATIFAGGTGVRVSRATTPFYTEAYGGGGGGNAGPGQDGNSTTNKPGAGGAGKLDDILLSNYYWGAGGAGSGDSGGGSLAFADVPNPNLGQTGTNGNASDSVGRGGGLYDGSGNSGFHGVVIARVPKYVVKLSQT